MLPNSQTSCSFLGACIPHQGRPYSNFSSTPRLQYKQACLLPERMPSLSMSSSFCLYTLNFSYSPISISVSIIRFVLHLACQQRPFLLSINLILPSGHHVMPTRSTGSSGQLHSSDLATTQWPRVDSSIQNSLLICTAIGKLIAQSLFYLASLRFSWLLTKVSASGKCSS